MYFTPPPRRLSEERGEIQILSKGFVKIPVRMLSVVNVRIHRSEAGRDSPFMVKTKVQDTKTGGDLPTRWNLLSDEVLLGADPDDVARAAINAHFGGDDSWVEGFALDAIRKVNVLDSSGLTRGNRAHLPGLSTEGIKSSDADDAKRQLETCSESKYPGCPLARIFELHLPCARPLRHRP